ncbi:hypothetical protein BHM03_00046941 [Ensete ventricosum]|nr:hypothetical protein BHM03_00046941 [Ensete ventricosum]
MIGAVGELDCFNAHIRLREPGKPEDKADAIVPQRWIYRWQERDVDARQQIVGPWAWQCHGTTKAGPPWRYRSVALIEGEGWSRKGPRKWRIQRQTPSTKIG